MKTLRVCRGPWSSGFLFLVIAALMLAPPPRVFGQSYNGVINGRVVDPQGSSVPDAHAVLVDVDRGTTYETTSNNAGLFIFPAVLPATYKLTVTAKGFRTYVKNDLVLYASDHLSAGTIELSLGNVTQTVTVKAATTPVQVSSSDRSVVLDSRQIGELMTEGRNLMQLTQTMPGVVLDGHGSPDLGLQQTGFVNGLRNDYNNVTIDGVTGSVTHQTQLDTPVDVDSVKEVKVIESGYEAQYGKTAGGQIQIETKSGTHNFHGSGFYYVQNTALNANNFLNNAHPGTPIPRPNWKYNVIGGTIGGPVYWPGKFNSNRDKLFFFFTGEKDPNTTPEPGSGVYHWNMPEYTVNGDGSVTFPKDQYNPGVPTINDPLTGKPFAGVPANTVPANRIDSNMLKLLQIFPQPNAPAGSIPGCSACNYFITGSDSTPRDVEELRLDYNLSARWHFFWMGKLVHEHESGLSTPAGLPQWLGREVPIDYATPTPGTSLGITTIISPTVVNEVTLGTEYWYESQIFPKSSTLPLVQLSHYGITVPSINPMENPQDFIPDLGFGGSDTSNNPGYHLDGRFPMRDSAWSQTLNDDLTKVIGSHTLKFGLAWEREEYVQLHNRQHFNGYFDFAPNSNYANSGYAYSDMLLGLYNNYQQPLQRPDYKPVTRVLEWYAQDEWRATPRLTLNYGVRFSKIFPQTLTQGANWSSAFYNPADAPLLYEPANCKYTEANGKTKSGRNATNPNQPGSCFPAAYIGQLIPGTGDFNNGIGVVGDSRFPDGLVGSHNFAAAPRIGFAWDVFGDGKTALRADYGIAYNTLLATGQEEGNLTFNPPVGAYTTLYYGSLADINSSVVGITSPPNFGHASQLNPYMPVAYDTALDLQHEIGFGTVLDVSYVGTFGRHFTTRSNVNEVPFCSRFLPQNQDPTNTSANTNAYASSGDPNTYAVCKAFSPGLVGKLIPTLKTYHALPDDFFRPYAGLSNINMIQFNGNSNYNALQVWLRHRFSHSIEFDVAYTWSKTMDTCDGGGGDSGRHSADCALPTYVPLQQWQYGFAGYDRTHILHADWVWDVPSLARNWGNPLARGALDGWKYQGLATFESGPPMFASLSLPGIDSTGGGDGARPVLLQNASLASGKRATTQWFNTSAFAAPVFGSLGNEGRTSFRGPGIINFDMALNKDFRLGERATMEFRCEAYDAFNHTNFDGLNTTAEFNYNGTSASPLVPLTTNGFGEVTGTRNPRHIELALRLTF